MEAVTLTKPKPMPRIWMFEYDQGKYLMVQGYNVRHARNRLHMAWEQKEDMLELSFNDDLIGLETLHVKCMGENGEQEYQEFPKSDIHKAIERAFLTYIPCLAIAMPCTVVPSKEAGCCANGVCLTTSVNPDPEVLAP